MEAAFKTIRSGFSQHIAGYKGYKVDQRGRQAEQHARWTLSDIEFFFAEYVILVYQRRHHSGLVLPGFDNLKLSPNDAYRILIHKSGYVACPTDPNLYLELLPIEWLTRIITDRTTGSTCPDLRLLIDYMFTTESAEISPLSFRRVE